MMRLQNAKITKDTFLSALIADRLGLLVWAKTKDGQHGRNRPRSLVEMLISTDQPDKKMETFASGAEFEQARLRILEGMNHGN